MIITWFMKNVLEKLKDFSRTKIIFVHTCYLFIGVAVVLEVGLTQGQATIEISWMHRLPNFL